MSYSKWNWSDDLTRQSSQENFQIQEIREERPFDLGSSSPIKPSSSESSSSSPTPQGSPSSSLQRRSQRDGHPPIYLQHYECGQVVTTFFW